MKKTYIVTRDFWDGPILRTIGETLALTDDQAKYLGNRIEEARPSRPARGKRAVAPEVATQPSDVEPHE